MALTEEQKTAMNLAAAEMCITGKPWMEEFASRFLAALPKPEPVGHYMGEDKDGSDCVYLYRDIKKNQMLYTEATIVPPASEQKPMAWATTNEDGDYAMLFFDQQEARSYSGGDEPIGLAPVSSSAPRPDYKAQRDAERYRCPQCGTDLPNEHAWGCWNGRLARSFQVAMLIF